MNEDLRIQTFGELNHESFDLEIITWKVPNVSSMLFAVDYPVQSPPFSFAGASWILKMYFYGQTKFNSKGYIDVIVERIHSETELHDLSLKIYCKNVYDREFHPVNKKFSFSSNHTKMNMFNMMKNCQRKSDMWEIAPNDIFTLVCEAQNMKSIEEEAGKISTATKNEKKSEVSDILQTSYRIETIKWTIRNVSSLPSPEDYQVQSPPFSFASAYWTLKIYPHFQLEHANKKCFYVALTRLHSQIPDHYVCVSICFEDRIKKAFDEVSRSNIFDSDHNQGDVTCFILQEEQITAPHDIFTLLCKFKIKNNTKNKWESAKLTESIVGNNSKSGCSSAHNKILQDLKELYLKQKDCDAVIRVKDWEFPAHQAILKARSSVFDSAFRNDMKEKATGVIDIDDCNPTSFSDFLCFLYCGDIENLNVENVFNLFITADKYDVQDLRLKCLEFMKENLTVDTFCDTIILALQYSEIELIKLSTGFFAENLRKIIMTVKWQSFLTKYPIQSNELLIKALMPNNNE